MTAGELLLWLAQYTADGRSTARAVLVQVNGSIVALRGVDYGPDGKPLLLTELLDH